jgi:hypothetical protein
MKRLMISAVAAVVLLAVAILWSHGPSIGHTVGIANTTSLQKSGTTAEAKKLPIEEYEDMSLVYSAPPKR